MAFKTTYSQYDNKTGLFSTEGALDLTTLPSNENKITASDGAAFDYFGYSVAVGNGRIVVGANEDNDNGSDSGSAYIFDLNGTQLAKITASDGAADDRFGNSVAVGSGRIVVGAQRDDDNGNQSGSAYIFDLDGTQLAKITPSDGALGDFFGQSVAVGDGRIVVGAYGDEDNGSDSGSAYIFDLDGTQLAKITASDGAAGDRFGQSVAIGSGRIVVAADGDDDDGSQSGSAYIFDLDGTQLAKITASDANTDDVFGVSVAVGSGRIVVGAYGNDNIDPWAFNSGSAYIFDLDGTQLAKITASDAATSDYFGNSVAVGCGRIFVGASNDNSIDGFYDSGSVYIFDLDGTQLGKITASSGDNAVYFGNSVAVGSGKLVVGAYRDSSSQGSAHIYETPNIKDIFSIVD